MADHESQSSQEPTPNITPNIDPNKQLDPLTTYGARVKDLERNLSLILNPDADVEPRQAMNILMRGAIRDLISLQPENNPAVSEADMKSLKAWLNQSASADTWDGPALLKRMLAVYKEKKIQIPEEIQDRVDRATKFLLTKFPDTFERSVADTEYPDGSYDVAARQADRIKRLNALQTLNNPHRDEDDEIRALTILSDLNETITGEKGIRRVREIFPAYLDFVETMRSAFSKSGVSAKSLTNVLAENIKKITTAAGLRQSVFDRYEKRILLQYDALNNEKPPIRRWVQDLIHNEREVLIGMLNRINPHLPRE